MEDSLKDSIDFDMLNEKINPRKRMKGRRGCVGAGPKGTQRRFFRGKEYYSKYFPGYIDKYRNKFFDEDKINEEDIKRIDDGNMDYIKRGNNWNRMRGFPNPIAYSINKKKRWELEEKLRKENGYFSHLPNSTAMVQNEIEEEKDKIPEDKEYMDTVVEIEQLEKEEIEKRKKNKELKKKKKSRKPEYMLDYETKEYNEINRGEYIRYNMYERRKMNRLKNSMLEKQRIERGRNEEKRSQKNLKKKKNRLHRRMKELEKEIEEKREEIKSVDLNIENLKNKNHRGRRKRKKKVKVKEMKRKKERIEMDKIRDDEKKKMKEIVLNNPNYYEFEHKESMKEWSKRTRNRYNYGRRWWNLDDDGPTRRRKIKGEIRDTLDLKY